MVLVAVVAALSARFGGEIARLAGRSTTSHGIVARLTDVPALAWWSACAVTMAVSALAQRRSADPRAVVVALGLLAVVFTAHGAAQWGRLATPRTGEFSGVAYARTDALVRGPALTLIVEVAGENHRLTVRGRDRSALRGVRMGDTLLIDAVRVAHDERSLRFSAGRHVQGELRDVVVHATAPAPRPWHRAANRVHELVDRGSRTMGPHDAALVRGLVLGDESRQPSRMTGAFRSAGLGHLLAVSGQNVALLLAALTPLLRRLSRWPRLAAALGVVAMFALVTRLESSVVRAAVMAAVVQVGYAAGRDVAPLRALAVTVAAIVALDPLATWSIGFVLSVAATSGLVVLTPLLPRSIFSATVAAQLGVAPFVLVWFGSMPLVALLTNVLAVPVASAVMILGPPLLGVAAFVPEPLAEWCAAPIVAAVRWVWWVAELGSRPAPPGWLETAGWCGVLVLVARRVAAAARAGRHRRAML